MAFIICFLSLTACSSDKYEKELLCSNLLCDYKAGIEFVLSDNSKNLSGKADISKGSITTLTFTGPSEYEGISIKSDSTGSPDTFTFELSGIPADVPKSTAGDLSLLFSLFDSTIPVKISSLDEGFFTQKDNGLIEVSFNENGFDYCIVYSSQNGIPSSISAGNDKTSLSVTISNFTLSTQQ